MPTIDDKKPLRGLKTRNEQLALQIIRFQSHVGQVAAAESVWVENERLKAEAEAEHRARMTLFDRNIAEAKNNVVFFVAEAREQFDTLQVRFGLSETEIDGLCPIPKSMRNIDITAVVPESIRTRNKG